MQFAAFTQSNFLTVAFPGVLSLFIVGPTSRSTAALSAKPEMVERVYGMR